MPYPEMLVSPMRAELSNNGFEELKSSEEVANAFGNTEGTILFVDVPQDPAVQELFIL